MFGLGGKFESIRMTGIDNTKDIERKGGYVHVYGVRESDVANRVVGVAVSKADALDLVSKAQYEGALPTIEVPARSWFYVAVLGPSSFEKDSLPS